MDRSEETVEREMCEQVGRELGMTIRKLDAEGRSRYEVLSPSGNTYTVTYAGMGDGDPNVNLWNCTCPAGDHGMTCKHIKVVAEVNNRVCDELGQE